MRIHAITIDTANPQKLASWWSQALEIAIANDYGMLVQLAASPDFPVFQFQRIEEVPMERNRVHVDLKTLDLDGDTERLVALGAIVMQKFELPQICYTTLIDPEGNKFDLIAQ